MVTPARTLACPVCGERLTVHSATATAWHPCPRKRTLPVDFVEVPA